MGCRCCGAPGVVGTQNEIYFDPFTRIIPDRDGQPNCQVERSIDKDATRFLFLPPDCDPESTCDGLRVFVLSVDNTAAIPSGAVLYRCAVRVDDHAPPGAYALVNANAAASDADGQPVDTRATSGVVDALCAGDCDGDGAVAIFEIVRGLNVLLGSDSLSVCPVFDVDGDGDVRINEVILAISNALRGCAAGA